MIGEPLLLGDEGGYNLTRSLRFRSSATAYLNRTPATASNRKTFTWSGWVKRGTLSTYQNIFSATTGGYPFILRFDNDNTIFVYQDGTSDYGGSTSAVYRDPAAWYHIVLAMDTTQATDTNRLKLYVNGVQNSVSAFYGYFALNLDTSINSTGAHTIGQSGSANYYDGYMAEVNFIDGQALDPSSFGAFSIYNQWLPKKYAGTYGTNGFRLPFTNNASTTTLGYDFSPQGNNWTTNNISVTAGATYDSMTDVPTLTSATAANYAVISPFQLAISGPLFVLSDGNLNYSCSASSGNAGRMIANGSMAMSTSKTYWEVKVTNTNPYIGIGTQTQIADNGSGSRKSINVYNAGQSADNTSATYTGTTFTFVTNDVIGFAFDGTAMTMGCYKNGSLIGTWSGIDSTVTWLPSIGINASGSSTSMEANFGQRPFAYTPPSGYLALNTFNL